MSQTHHERLMTVIRGPHVSEKSHLASQVDQVVLKVRVDATKDEIRQAVELLFPKTRVKDIKTLNVKGKNKRFGRTQGRRKDWKKAYVRLADGSQIESMFGGE
ncbi:MAG: 50S ribosomal protein L23 [Pseudomonadota bacterium]